jgi:hypothetical protein
MHGRFADPARREWWGYGVWGTATLVVLISEITAASDGDSPWPTISGTVGHLEYSHSWVALIVVALIVFVGFQILRYRLVTAQPVVQANGRVLRRTDLGRFTMKHQGPTMDEQTELPVWMVVISTAVVAFGSLATAELDPSDKFVLAYVLYGLIAVFFVLIPSALAFWCARDVPFPTFFRTIANLERRLHFVSVLVVIGLVILLIHLALYPWPSIFHQLQKPTPNSL